MNDIFNDTSPYKANILKNIENVLNMKENMSCYDLLRYDLSEGIIKKIIANRVSISDLMYEDVLENLLITGMVKIDRDILNNYLSSFGSTEIITNLDDYLLKIRMNKLGKSK